jgi:hypothetical protein
VILTTLVGLSWSFLRRRRSGIRQPGTHSSKHPPSAATPIDFLPGINSSTWAPLVAREPMPIVAGLLRRLPPDDVAQVIAQLSPVQQRDVLELAPSVGLGPSELEAMRQRILAAVPKAAPEFPPSDAVCRPATAPVVQRSPSSERPTVFDDLIGADEESLRTLSTRVHAETWSAALMGASPKLQRRLSRLATANGRPRGGTERRPVRLREIESAQRMIIDEWQALQVHG